MKGRGLVTGGDGLAGQGLVPRRGPAQPSNLNHLTESGTQDIPTHSQAFPSESVPPVHLHDLCIVCGERPRAAGGQLSRCIPCIKAEAARARDARAAAETRVAFPQPPNGATTTMSRFHILLLAVHGPEHAVQEI